MSELSLFERVIMEAEDDTPADTPPDIPPDLPPDTGEDDTPVDMVDDEGGLGGEPPDIGGGDENQDGGIDSWISDGEGGVGEDPNELELDEKISAILNMQLYQDFLSLLNNIGNQLSVTKTHSDVLRTLSIESLDIIGSLKKLNENIRLYLNNYFLIENYSANLLFFNKCINLLKLLNEIFEKEVKKGIRGME